MDEKYDLAGYDYELPQELIAQVPVDDREKSRLLVLDEKTGKTEHKSFEDIIDYLQKDDVLVINNTKVLPWRLLGHKVSGAYADVILVEKKDENEWLCLLTTRNPKPGTKILFTDKNGKDIQSEVVSKENNFFRIRFEKGFDEFIKNNGVLPMPPYVKNQSLIPQNRYQTIYSKKEGSLAAPTAGLHFTQDILQKIRDKGVKIAEVCLHVSIGTFMPIRAKNILEHKMHPEYFHIDKENADLINNRKGKLIVVGTTSLKALESASDEKGKIRPISEHSTLYITPAHKFNVKVDAMITNFHLPKSTLIILLCSLFDKKKIFKAYEEAIEQKYRFYSFGDAMLIKK